MFEGDLKHTCQELNGFAKLIYTTMIRGVTVLMSAAPLRIDLSRKKLHVLPFNKVEQTDVENFSILYYYCDPLSHSSFEWIRTYLVEQPFSVLSLYSQLSYHADFSDRYFLMYSRCTDRSKGGTGCLLPCNGCFVGESSY